MANFLNEIKFNNDGLIPTITQDYQTGNILMMAWMNKETLKLTINENRAIYFSRSRKKIWRKGEESGNIQLIKSIHLDCDSDVILLKVIQVNETSCHTNRYNCFYRTLINNQWEQTQKIKKNINETYMNDVLTKLSKIIEQRKQNNNKNSYVSNLHNEGLDKILKKVGEEATEVIISAKNAKITGNNKDIIYETADLWFHSIVMLSHLGESPQSIINELENRLNISGIVEKINRKK